MPSSTAARVADRASSMRCLRSLSSVSVAAPTLMTATPPASLAKALLELFPVVVGVGLLDLPANLGHPALDIGRVALAVDDGRLVFGRPHLTRLAQHIEGDVFQLEPELLRR